MTGFLNIQFNPGHVPDLINLFTSQVAVNRGLMQAGLHLKAQIARYPPSPGGRHQPFVSDKQRRGFFAKLRSGEIEVPYRRGMSPGSERLAQRWAVVQNGNRVIVGNNASYASLVQGSQQTGYHKQTGWQTAEDVAKAENAALARIVRQSLELTVKELARGSR